MRNGIFTQGQNDQSGVSDRGDPCYASRCVTMRHDASRLKESAVAKSWSYRDGAAQAWLGPGSVLARWMLNLLSLMTCSAFGKPMASTMIPMVYIYLIYHEFMNIFIVTIIIVVAQS